MLWKYTWRDSIPLSVTLFQLALNVWIAATWYDRTLLQNLLFLPLCVFLFWYNGLVASHNFVHTPWFKAEWLNQLYLVINSINIGLPQIYYRYEHLLHHRYVNDRQDAYGHTNDPTSLFAHGQQGEPEPVWSYCALGIFRANLVAAFREIIKRGEKHQLCVELVACMLGLLGFLYLSWQYVLVIFIPTFYLGWFLEHLENYYEHFGGIPENRYANSTSYYGELYNLLFCNEGYHQEHHLRPGVHWTKRKQTRQEWAAELDAANRVILRFPPILAILDHRRIQRKHRSVLPVSMDPEVAMP
ncbi:fatty acid desaturase family protein [Thermocoleostomius sinensis]|uniref:Fatty acid desaturase n=1 Tax=Thermocoleostomius sinensis A174 TaxID=2016057 RepID=A0A9E8ZCF4_9CYAN|nr:fatty acid desaturase [Thermocoleostomius sinensis]WAL58695.1 fatty acid desaturase [Thermocoleostomius sinensis A174]